MIRSQKGIKDLIDRLEQIRQEGWTDEDINKGYAIFKVDDTAEVIQKIDLLDDTPYHKFESDTEAGAQALEDGYDVTYHDKGEYAGWFVLNKEGGHHER